MRNSGGVEEVEVSTGSPEAISFRDHVKRAGPWGEDWRTIPAFSILRNSAWAEASLSKSMRWALANTAGPGIVGRSCFGEGAKKTIRGEEHGD